MDLQLADKVALVAASSHGLGRAIAVGFTGEGARVVICGLDQKTIDDAVQDVRDASAEVITVEADLKQAGDIERLVQQAIDASVPIDILLTNVGGPPPGTFLGASISW